MTDDLVSRLRARATNTPSNDDAAKLWGAAVRIESLEAENATLRAGMAGLRKTTIEEAAKMAEGYAPRSFDSSAIAAAIRNMGERL